MDIATDKLHASSSDLITRNTLAMMRLKLQRFTPERWQEIAAASLDAWDKRDQQKPFLTDDRRGNARVTPAGLTSTGVTSQTLPPADQCPLHGLGFCDEKESSTQFHFTTYVRSIWTRKAVLPTRADQSLTDMLKGPARGSVLVIRQSKSSGQVSKPSDSVNKGSDEPPAQSLQGAFV